MECHFMVLINDRSTYPPNYPPPKQGFHKALRETNGIIRNVIFSDFAEMVSRVERNPSVVLLMAEIRRAPVEVGSFSHYLEGFSTIPGGDRRISAPSTVVLVYSSQDAFGMKEFRSPTTEKLRLKICIPCTRSTAQGGGGSFKIGKL